MAATEAIVAHQVVECAKCGHVIKSLLTAPEAEAMADLLYAYARGMPLAHDWKVLPAARRHG